MKHIGETFLPSIINYLHEDGLSPIFVLDAGHRIEYCNKAFQALLPSETFARGIRIDELFNTDVSAVFKASANTKEQHKIFWNVKTIKGVWRFECHMYCEGDLRLIIAEKPVMSEESIIAKMGALNLELANMTRDLKKRKVEAETDNQKLQLAKEELRRSKEAAEAANLAKSEFLANMSHEIRTPMNGMLGMIDLALMSELTSEQERYLGISKSCADSLLRIINNILDLSRLEAGKVIIDNIQFRIQELVDELMQTYSREAVQKGLSFKLVSFDGVPLTVVGDLGRLKQVLNNLITNALKFTEKGGVTLSVRGRSMDNDDVELTFVISDTGIGIAAGEQDKLFQSFSQVDSSITRRFGGTGLGLAISKRLVEMMGGNIWVESKKDTGSTFSFSVKLKVVPRVDVNLCQKKVKLRTTVPLHILLVEDDQINRKFLISLLKQIGCSADEAENGEVALGLLKAKQYDLILMDIQMPVMDGVEVTRRIRDSEKETDRHMPIIAVTAYALAGDSERFRAVGIDDYVAKPVNVEELFHKLEQFSHGARKSMPLNISASESTDFYEK